MFKFVFKKVINKCKAIIKLLFCTSSVSSTSTTPSSDIVDIHHSEKDTKHKYPLPVVIQELKDKDEFDIKTNKFYQSLLSENEEKETYRDKYKNLTISDVDVDEETLKARITFHPYYADKPLSALAEMSHLELYKLWKQLTDSYLEDHPRQKISDDPLIDRVLGYGRANFRL